jgi:hypothetical protein
MNLVNALLDLPRPVAKAIYDFVFLPAQDMHPEQSHLPDGLPELTPRAHSLILAPDQNIQWTEQLDWNQLPQRLCMLPQHVLETLSWHLGLVLNSSALRQVVLRTQIEQLTQQGMVQADWSFVHSLPAQDAQPRPAPVAPLAVNSLQHSGWQALGQLAKQLPPALQKRFGWKLPHWVKKPQGNSIESPTLQLALECAYPTVVNAWLPEWENSLLAQAKRGT